MNKELLVQLENRKQRDSETRNKLLDEAGLYDVYDEEMQKGV